MDGVDNREGHKFDIVVTTIAKPDTVEAALECRSLPNRSAPEFVRWVIVQLPPRKVEAGWELVPRPRDGGSPGDRRRVAPHRRGDPRPSRPATETFTAAVRRRDITSRGSRPGE